MRTLEKVKSNKLPQADIIINNDKYAFLDGIEMFTEKHARAKETLSKMKITENWTSK